MSANPYPNLGFNPIPGAVSDVAGLQDQISKASEAVKETNGLLTRLRNSNDDVWKGEAGNAFRAKFDATLAQDLGYAQSSLEKAVALIQEWHTNLVNFQETAKGLDTEAAEAKGQHTQAVATLQQAKANPDLSLANTSSDPESVRAAQARLDAAVAKVNAASAAVDDWQARIDAIIKRARDLETTHDALARRIARELDTAAKDFAPSPPDKSIWDRITDAIKGLGDWITEHSKQIHDVLSAISSVTGLLSLVTPPPINAICAVTSLVTGVGALAINAADPEVRKAFSDVFTGNGDGSDYGKIFGVGLDAAGAIPGIGAGIKAVNMSADIGSAVTKFTELSAEANFISKGVNNGLEWGKTTSLATPANWASDKMEAVSNVSKFEPGTALMGIEMFQRAGMSAFDGTSAIKSVFFND